jgi:ribosomal-protein-alanine N-acetyltransferase
MSAGDLDQVQAIDQLSFSLPWPASAFRYELMDNPNSLLWVAESANPYPRILGMVVIWLILDEAHIATIAVHPDYRGHGIGARLLLIALLEAIQNGASTATLEVRNGNFNAQELYRRFRFEIAGRRPRYYRDNNEDALLMTVDLNRPYMEWLERGGWEG